MLPKLLAALEKDLPDSSESPQGFGGAIAGKCMLNVLYLRLKTKFIKQQNMYKLMMVVKDT